MRLALLLAVVCACRISNLVIAIDRGETARASTLVEGGADPNDEDAAGNSALMLAVWHGDAALVASMLAHGGDAKHANDAGATALHWAIDDVAKVRALLAAGADPNARDAAGNTPLELAAGHEGDGEVVALMLEHGGDAKRVDGDLGAGDAVGTLLAHGANAKRAVITAAIRGNVEGLRAIVAPGAPGPPGPHGAPSPDVNATGSLGMTALMWAAQNGHTEAVTFLLAHGADPNIVEAFNHSTALMQAAASERAEPALVQALLDAHADPAPLDDEHTSALAWAIRRGNPAVISMIAAHERGPRPVTARRATGVLVGDQQPRAAIQRALPLLEHARPEFRRLAGCPSCHHDALPALALARVHAIGIPIDLAARAREAKTTADFFRRGRERFLQGYGFADIVECAYLLVGLAASDYPPDEITAAMARFLELQQAPDGRWRAAMQRMPADGSDVTMTALAIRALAVYAPNPARIGRARAYLESVAASTNEDLVFRLLGLHWAGATNLAAEPLVARQRPDGSFAQLDGMLGDPYATAQAIVALREVVALPADDPVIHRAVQYLLTHQYADGSWFVASRALRFQPFFDSHFPQGRSQYSSALATAWAVMALADAAP